MEAAAGPPPPPPPPPFQTEAESARPVPTEASAVIAMRAMHKGPPAALAGAMLKDKKPFTYTPGGLDLSEIKSPRMQRRLQKNAACEGVRPSPLAQQPSSPTTPGAVPPLPPQGMVQVLPVPGMAMASPTKKAEPKEPSKPKRSVCGPPPPPPPFSISSSSADPSPSPTPYDSSSSTPIMNSTTSPSTPAEVLPPVFPATPPSTLPSASSASSTPATPVENGVSSLQPVMASEPGPSVPLPPPLPPLLKKRQVRRDVSPPSTEAENKITSSLPVTSSTENNENEKRQSSTDANNTKDLTSELNQALAELKQKSPSPVSSAQEGSIPKTYQEEYAEPQEEEKETETDTKQSRPVTPKSHETRWGLNDEDIIQELVVQDKTNKQHERISPVIRRTEDLRPSQNANNNKRHSNQLEYSSRQDTNIQDAAKKQIKCEQNELDNENKIQPLVQTSDTPPHYIEKYVSHDCDITHDKEVGQHSRPWMRMPSPPINTSSKLSKQLKDIRMVRQASLPAQPISPPFTLPTANAGSLYIPPVKIDQGGQADNFALTLGGRGDSTNSLDKGPLPWMRGHKKESSPPPEFMMQAQKTQQRLQRQRSLAEQPRKQQSETSSSQILKPQLNQQSFQGMTSYREPQTDPVIPPPDIFRDQIQATQPALRAPPGNTARDELYRDTPTYQSHQQAQPSQPNPFIHGYSQYQNQDPPQLQRPRERIIPIMLEGTPTTSPVKHNDESPSYNPATHPVAQRQTSWSKTPQGPCSLPKYEMGGIGVSHQEEGINPSAFNSSSSALEALQQMQQNLAQLNTGLQTAQPPPKQSGGTYAVPVQMTPTTPLNPDASPLQSRSFKVIQNVLNNHESANMSDPCEQPEPRKYTGSNIPSRSFKMLQAMTDESYQQNQTDV